MSENKSEVLEVSASDEIQSKDNFSPQAERQLKGTAGTLHITREETKGAILESAWNISKTTKLPVIIVVRAN